MIKNKYFTTFWQGALVLMFLIVLLVFVLFFYRAGAVPEIYDYNKGIFRDHFESGPPASHSPAIRSLYESWIHFRTDRYPLCDAEPKSGRADTEVKPKWETKSGGVWDQLQYQYDWKVEPENPKPAEGGSIVALGGNGYESFSLNYDEEGRQGTFNPKQDISNLYGEGRSNLSLTMFLQAITGRPLPGEEIEHCDKLLEDYWKVWWVEANMWLNSETSYPSKQDADEDIDYTVKKNEQIHFYKDETVEDPERGTQYSWDFGDGTGSTEAEPTHSYSSVGTYRVTFIVKQGNAVDKEQTTIIVEEQPEPYLYLTLNPDYMTKVQGQTAEFDIQSHAKNGFNCHVDLSLDQGVLPNIGISFGSARIPHDGTTKVRLSTSSSTNIQTYNVKLRGSAVGGSCTSGNVSGDNSILQVIPPVVSGGHPTDPPALLSYDDRENKKIVYYTEKGNEKWVKYKAGTWEYLGEVDKFWTNKGGKTNEHRMVIGAHSSDLDPDDVIDHYYHFQYRKNDSADWEDMGRPQEVTAINGGQYHSQVHGVTVSYIDTYNFFKDNGYFGEGQYRFWVKPCNDGQSIEECVNEYA
ncbi:MAG TPA: hypothetical protein DEG92_01620, partial [Rikenellaceae bacterium]|nr:hypothetical protein [Rikenellaceae bacterium]